MLWVICEQTMENEWKAIIWTGLIFGTMFGLSWIRDKVRRSKRLRVRAKILKAIQKLGDE